LCLLLVVSLVTLADAANPSRVGTAGAQELLIPVGARGIAIGGSNMVFATGVDAIFWNPAGLGRQPNSVEGIVSSMNYIADINVVYAGLGVQAGEFGTLGFTVKSVGFGNIAVTTTEYPDGTGENYSPTFITLGATYAKSVTDRIAVGITANLVSERIMSVSGSGLAVNVGIQYQNLGLQGLDLGITVKNLGTDLKFSGSDLLHKATSNTGLRGSQLYSVEAAANEMPSCLEIGLGYTHKFDERNFAKVGGMFRNNNFQGDEYNVGAEYSFDNLFFVRGGYTLPGQNTKDAVQQREYIFDYTLGAGLHYIAGGVDLSFDYAYRHQKYFDASNIITLKIGI